MKSGRVVYLEYLRQALESGLPPDGRRWDVPCPWFEAPAKDLVRLGYARKRWFLFGPLVITPRGLEALERRVV